MALKTESEAAFERKCKSKHTVDRLVRISFLNASQGVNTGKRSRLTVQVDSRTLGRFSFLIRPHLQEPDCGTISTGRTNYCLTC